MAIPFDLKQAIETGSAILFVGAGMGHNMVGDDGKPIPDGPTLANMIAEEFKVPSNGVSDLPKIAQFVIGKMGGRGELCTFIRGILEKANPDEAMMWIPTVRWKAIFTTNYDDCIERAYNQCASAAQEYLVVTHLSCLSEHNPAYQVPIFHLHGSLFKENSPDIIISQNDFIRYSDKRESLFDLLKTYMASSCILYTGYSHNDPNFSKIIDDLERELFPDLMPKSYRIDPNTSELDKALLSQRNIITIPKTFSDFVSEAKIEIPSISISQDTFVSYQHRIPSNFMNLFETNPAPTIRLLTSWDYVNQLIINANSSLHDFLRGNKADWGIIYKGLYFSRTIEPEIFDSIVEHVTAPKNKVDVTVVLAPAGYGMSTLLKSLAKKISDERIADVFFHKCEKDFRAGDVLFACERDPDGKHIFFVDDAANYLREIKMTITHAAQNNYDCLFVLGDRINEWYQKRVDIRGNYFTIQPLDDLEIENLLDFLREHHELNRLADLPREHQVAAIKRNYNRELLVAIREATEGRDFDAIIQNEFYAIESDYAKKCYAIIACFHQNGVLLRPQLLASLMKSSLIEMYDNIRVPLQGIVFYEDIFDGVVDYAVRSRHRIISEIVWNRCIKTDEKDEIIISAINSLNITYRIDKDAFEKFVFTEAMVDSLSSDESKQRFFERACKMDPDNPFVRQHYARMLLRIRRYNAALAMIDQAIQLDQTQKILYHTKGYILQHMAMESESIDIGRRYLVQSEEELKKSLHMNEKDAYCYQGLASLYLSWAKREISDYERTLNLAKAEEIVQMGLIKARDKEAIWITSASIDEFVGDMPNRIRSLEKAVSDAPSSVLSRYLLSKAYVANEQYDDAKKLLEEIVFESPNEYRSVIEYAKLILITEKNIKHAIAVLEQGTLYGYSDGLFVAILGGLYFIDRQFTRADAVFKESMKRKYISAWKPLFIPSQYGIFPETEARIMYVSDNYCRIQIEGYPLIKCRTSKFDGVVLVSGMKVNVILEVTSKEVIARIISFIN